MRFTSLKARDLLLVSNISFLAPAALSYFSEMFALRAVSLVAFTFVLMELLAPIAFLLGVMEYVRENKQDRDTNAHTGSDATSVNANPSHERLTVSRTLLFIASAVVFIALVGISIRFFQNTCGADDAKAVPQRWVPMC